MARDGTSQTGRLASVAGAIAAVALHGAIAAAVAGIDPAALVARPPQSVEMEVLEPPPPPPPPAPEEPRPQEPPPEPVRPRVAMRRLAPKPVIEQPTPPPPNQEPPAEPPKEQAPPTFGVTLDSTVTGESNMAVPVGNTLMTNDRTPPKTSTPPQPYAAAPSSDFAPVPDTYLAEFPVRVKEVEAVYPEQARRLGIEGKVLLKLGIDRRGNVRSVRVIKKAGNGLDEAATKAMWQMKFRPARTKDGQAVDCQINYTYVFRAAG